MTVAKIKGMVSSAFVNISHAVCIATGCIHTTTELYYYIASLPNLFDIEKIRETGDVGTTCC